MPTGSYSYQRDNNRSAPGRFSADCPASTRSITVRRSGFRSVGRALHVFGQPWDDNPIAASLAGFRIIRREMAGWDTTEIYKRHGRAESFHAKSIQRNIRTEASRRHAAHWAWATETLTWVDINTEIIILTLGKPMQRQPRWLISLYVGISSIWRSVTSCKVILKAISLDVCIRLTNFII